MGRPTPSAPLMRINMKPQNTFIAPSVIALRDGIKKLSISLEARPKPPAGAAPEAINMLEHFHEFQVRLGGVLDAYEMEIDKMLAEL